MQLNGYKLLDVRGANLILVNQINLALPDSIYPNKLEDCFNYFEQKRHVKTLELDQNLLQCKNFSQRPGILLRLKVLISVGFSNNYSLRRKLIP